MGSILIRPGIYFVWFTTMVQIIAAFTLVLLTFGGFQPAQAMPLTLTQICRQPDRFLSPEQKLKCGPVRELWAAYKSYQQSVEKVNQYESDIPSLTCFRYMKNISNLHNQYLVAYQQADSFYRNRDENFALIHVAKMEILSNIHKTLYEVALLEFEGGFEEERNTFTSTPLKCMDQNREAWLADVKDRQEKMDLLRNYVLRFISKKYTDTIPQLFFQKKDQLRKILTAQAVYKQTMFGLTIWHAISFKKILLGLRIATTVGAVVFAGNDSIKNNLKSMDFNFHTLSNSEESKRKGREAIRATVKTLDSDTYSSFLDSVKVISEASPQYEVYEQMFYDIEKIRRRSTALSNTELEAAKEILK